MTPSTSSVLAPFRSWTTRPSARNRMRSAMTAARASCVTITIVWPYVSTESRSELEDLAAGLRVEVAGRLVRKQDRRLRDERARDRNALLLSARELRRPVRSTSREARLLQQLVEPRGVGLLAGDRQRQGDVLFRGEHRQKVEELEHEPDVLAAELRHLRVAEVRDLGARDRHRPARRLVEAGERVHERRLAGAGRPHDGDELARLHVERHAAERVDGRRPRAVAAREVMCLDDDAAQVRGTARHGFARRRHPSQTSDCPRSGNLQPLQRR